MELQAKVKKLGNLTEGESANGQWIKQELIVETIEQYPKTVCVTCWGERASAVQMLQTGDTLKLGVNIESREYNGRWYTEVKAYSIAKMSEQYIKANGQQTAQQTTQQQGDFFGYDANDLPFD